MRLKTAFYLALTVCNLISLQAHAQSSSLEIKDDLSKVTLSKSQVGYYYEDHDAEKLVPPWELSKSTLPMIKMSRKEQDSYLRSLLPKILSHPFLSIDSIKNQKFTSLDAMPFKSIVAWKYVWYKFTLNYHGPDASKRVIIKPGFNCDYCYLYSQNIDGHIKFEGYTGRILPKSSDQYLYTGNYFATDINRKETTFFILARDQYSFIQPEVLSHDTFTQEVIIQLIIEAAVFGAGLFALLYYSFLAFYSKDKAYIDYTYLIGFSYLFFLITQSITKFLDLFSFFVIIPGITQTIHIFVYISEVKFMLSYLNADRIPRVYQAGKKLILGGSALALILAPLNQIGFISITWIAAPFLLLIFICCTFSGAVMLYSCLQRRRSGYIFTTVGAVVAIAVMVNYTYFFLGWSNEFIAEHYNLVRFSFFSAISAFSLEMGTRLKIANDQLKLYINKVEELVDQKTAKISTIMNNIRLGIFTIQDADQARIDSEYSKELEDIFDEEDIAQQSAYDLFVNRLDINSDQKSQVISFIKSSIGEDTLAYDVNRHLAPNEVVLQTGGVKKVLETDWSPIVQEDIVVSILVAVKDISDNKALEEEASQAKRELDIIDKILQVKPQSFNGFISAAKSYLESNRALISKNTSNVEEVVKILFINMHTLKGIARSYNFHHMTGCIHEIEQSYAALRNNSLEWDQAQLLDELQCLENNISEYETVSINKLGREASDNTLKVDPIMIKNVISLFKKEGKDEELQDSVFNYYRNLLYMNVKEVLFESLESVATLAKDLGKENPKIIIEGDHTQVDQEGASILKKAMIHIVRNSMDHGIEDAQTREAKGKAKYGSLIIHLKQLKDKLEIHFSDDGQGLNLLKIRKLAISKGLINPEMQYSDNQLASLIMEPGFSTADSVTEVSGRGVGMDAIKAYLEHSGGMLDLGLDETVRVEGYRSFYLILSLPSKFISISA